MIAKNISKEKERIIENSNKIVNNIATPKDNSRQQVTSKADIIPNTHRTNIISEEEQWDINNKLLLESYEEEEELSKEILSQDNIYDESELHNDFINSLDDESLHNLDNAIEAMDVEIGGVKRRREQYGETSVKNEGEKERPTRRAGKWPPEKDEFQPTYIPEQYKYMGSKRRGFERAVQFQNSKSDGAI